MKTLFGLFLLLFFSFDLDGYAQPYKQRRNRDRTSSAPKPAVPASESAHTSLESIESGKTASLYYSSHAIGAPGKRDRTRNLRQAGPASRQHDPHVREKLIYLHQRGTRDRGPIRSYYSPKNRATMRKFR